MPQVDDPVGSTTTSWGWGLSTQTFINLSKTSHGIYVDSPPKYRYGLLTGNPILRYEGKYMYDFLVVGAGLFGASVARALSDGGKRVLVVEKRGVPGGNCSDKYAGNDVYVNDYGAHIFHTNSKRIWDFVNKYSEFKQYNHKVVAVAGDGKPYSIPFNMWTFNQINGSVNAQYTEEAFNKKPNPVGKNLEEYGLEYLGKELYEKLVKRYTEKQWGRDAKELPASILARIPIRFNYNGDYFSDDYQGLPIHGYTNLVQSILDGIDCMYGVDYLAGDLPTEALGAKVIYSGPLDDLFDCEFGELEYRSCTWDEFDGDIGCATVNYTGIFPSYTRTIDYRYIWGNPEAPRAGKVFDELPCEWDKGLPKLYPINDEYNERLAHRYKKMAKRNGIVLGGRLGTYKYLNMDQAIAQALAIAGRLLDET